MLKHEDYIFNVVRTFGSQIRASLSGSFRRVEPTSGDIDVLVTQCNDDTFKKIITKFEKDGYITDILALGNKKCMAVGKLKRHKTYRRVDFMLTAEHEYPFALLYFTGSGTFNVAMRNWALARGYSLSEYGLKYHKGPRNGEFVDHDFKDEADIFTFLGLKYVEPKNRKDGSDLKDSQ
jgi:DNA polymerase (family 10)